MSESFIVDAHAHFGLPGQFFTPESSPRDLLRLMDLLSIRYAIMPCDHIVIHEGPRAGLASHRRVYEESQGRVFYLGIFDARSPDESLAALTEAAGWPGFAGFSNDHSSSYSAFPNLSCDMMARPTLVL